jgi:hypothetical protein
LCASDAEGRLILADALVEARSEDPDLIIDCATLTGAAFSCSAILFIFSYIQVLLESRWVQTSPQFFLTTNV